MAQRTDDNPERSAPWRRIVYIVSLMLAGESIYMLPYMRRSFQTSMEEVFNISASEVGLLNSMFGLLALACYFPGGWLADRFSARRLLTFSLISTGMGGFVMLLGPGFFGLLLIHAFWGVTSILTFWAALIKATRNWGGAHEQGLSFGLLDGGRGALAAVLATLAMIGYLGSADSKGSLLIAITIYSAAPVLVGVIVWFVVPDTLHEDEPEALWADRGETRRALFVRAARIPDVWFLGVAIFCAYTVYVATFEFPAFAENCFGVSKNNSVVLATFRDWMRPIGAIGAGLLADRFTAGKTVSGAFALLVVGFGSLFLMPVTPALLWLLWGQVALVGLAVVALRGIYYALLREIGIPMSLTGTTVGIVSVIGYTPDVFLHLVAGLFTEEGKAAGYQNYFGVMALVATAGLLVSAVIYLREKRATADDGEGAENDGERS